MWSNRPLAWNVGVSLALGVSFATPLRAASVETSTPTPLSLTVVHPTEGQRLPPLSQVFVFGAVTPGSTVTINGLPVTVHPQGGYLSMAPVKAGDSVLTVEAHSASGEAAKVERKISVASGFVPSPASPLTLERGSVSPFEDQWLAADDVLRVTFQGSSGAEAQFQIEGIHHKFPMVEVGTSTSSRRGIYEGSYQIQPEDKTSSGKVQVTLSRGKTTLKQTAAGRVTVDPNGVPRYAIVTEDTVAARTAPEGGYDLFLYKGMRVRLTGKIGSNWRVRLSSLQSGWVKESALQELPRGTSPTPVLVTNLTVSHDGESTKVRIPLSDTLPYRTEQWADPMRLMVTLYGAADKTDLIKHNTADSLLRMISWKQLSPDTVQIVLEPRFSKWWGYDVRYEGTTLVIEVRKPWTSDELTGMVIAVDPGHGGSDAGAEGPHSWFEKEANLAIARKVVEMLERAGAKPFLTREKDIDVPLYERPKIAWNRNARLFISVHCNSSGEAENPIWNNGFSTYWYQPQSAAFAEAIHSAYVRQIKLPDHGLFYADLAVCRMTQMPAVLTEQAFIIVPEQEVMLFDSKFHSAIAKAIVDGVRRFVAKP